jgi:hypothetical protein
MTDGIDPIQDREWRVLHDRIAETLDRFGRRDAFGDGDYWLVDDYWGQYRHLIEIQNLNLLQPHIVKLLQRQLSDYPRWEIRVGVDTVKFDRKWPGMGLTVYSDEILDELQRGYLPPEFRNLRYEGARRTVDRD